VPTEFDCPPVQTTCQVVTGAAATGVASRSIRRNGEVCIAGPRRSSSDGRGRRRGGWRGTVRTRDAEADAEAGAGARTAADAAAAAAASIAAARSTQRSSSTQQQPDSRQQAGSNRQADNSSSRHPTNLYPYF
jgi:hypothetical protein